MNRKCAFLKIYTIYTKIKTFRNYLARYLDTITKIELVIFILALGAYVFFCLDQKFDRIAREREIRDLWSYFILLIKVLSVLCTAGAYIVCRRRKNDARSTILMANPLEIHEILRAKIVDYAVLSIPFIPIYLILLLLFCNKTSMPVLTFFSGAGLLTLLFALSFLIGVNAAVLSGEPRRTPGRIWRFVFYGVASACYFFVLIFPRQMKLLPDLTAIFLLLTAGLILSIKTCIDSLCRQLKHTPDRFLKATSRLKIPASGIFADLFLLPVPKRQKSIVRKDILYGLRTYKIYVVQIFVLMVLMSVFVLTSENVHDATQWWISLCVVSVFVSTNIGFKFNQMEAEDLRFIRILPVSSKQYWWAKFWTNFLPNLWLNVLACVVVVLRHGFVVTYLLQGFAVSLPVAFTLVFVQNNFSLYSYPYARFASLWYNLYIILAATFFTIFLFPPLTLAFLIFGFLAIFRVQRRIETMELPQ